MHISIRDLFPEDIPYCAAINRALPDWFGLEEGLAEADRYLRNHTGIVAVEDGEVVGYLTYMRHFPESAEISWMAVAAARHRRGGGRALLRHLEEELAASGVRILSVKTLAASHPSPEYATTRAFYTAMGFGSQMVFPDLWDPANPCLLMVKYLDPQG